MNALAQSSRRRFLTSMTAASLTAAMTRTSPAAGRSIEHEDDLRLGFSLYGMKSLPLENAIRTCAEIGYSDVELCLNAGYPTELSVFTPDQRKATADLLTSMNIKASCLMVLLNLTADATGHRKNLELIAAAHKVEHYEIASYITARNLSFQLRMPELSRLLQMSLAEEQNSDLLLDQIGRPLTSVLGRPAAVI